MRKSYRNSRSFFSSDQSNTALVHLTQVDDDDGCQSAGEQLDTACYIVGSGYEVKIIIMNIVYLARRQ